LGLSGLLHLDGLISIGCFLHPDTPKRTASLPLERIGSCYAASAAIVEVPSARPVLGVAARLRWARVLYAAAGPELDSPSKAEGRWRGADPLALFGRRPRAGQAVACWWSARGDAEACLELLRPIQHLGATSKAGPGVGIEWRLHRVPGWSDFGLRDARGRPLRAIPLGEWGEMLGGERSAQGSVVGERRASPPYWEQTGAVPCVMPSLPQTIMSRAEIAAALGLGPI
jgi:hypothetical protein